MKVKTVAIVVSVGLAATSAQADTSQDLACLRGIKDRNALASGTSPSGFMTVLPLDGSTQGGAVELAGGVILIPQDEDRRYLVLGPAGAFAFEMPEGAEMVQLGDTYLRIYRNSVVNADGTVGPSRYRSVQSGMVSDKRAQVESEARRQQQRVREAEDLRLRAAQARHECRTQEASDLEAQARALLFLFSPRVQDLSGIPLVQTTPVDAALARAAAAQVLARMLATVYDVSVRNYQSWREDDARLPEPRRSARPRPGSSDDPCAAIEGLQVCAAHDAGEVASAARAALERLRAARLVESCDGLGPRR